MQADGGTRTASITGAWIALRDCLNWMTQRSILRDSPLKEHVAAVSCGVVGGEAVIDLDSAEGAPFSEAELLQMIALARVGIGQLVGLQKAAIV